MKKLLFVAVLAALVLAPTALGKELQSVSVCGPEGCNSSGGGGAAGGGGGAAGPGSPPFVALIRAFEGDADTVGAPTTILDAVPIGPYYELGVTVRGDHPPAGQFSIELWYVKPNLMRFLRAGEHAEPFKRLPPAASALLERLADGLKPYPAPKVVGAFVNGKRAAHPAQYIGLFSGLKSTDETLPGTGRWVDLSITPDRANPWFSSGMEFLYMPDDQALFFDKPVKVGYELASTIARDGGLPMPPKPDGRSWGRPVGIGVFVLWLVVATGLFLLWRRPRRPREQPTTA